MRKIGPPDTENATGVAYLQGSISDPQQPGK
jgi:hypothetical protein